MTKLTTCDNCGAWNAVGYVMCARCSARPGDVHRDKFGNIVGQPASEAETRRDVTSNPVPKKNASAKKRAPAKKRRA